MFTIEMFRPSRATACGSSTALPRARTGCSWTAGRPRPWSRCGSGSGARQRRSSLRPHRGDARRHGPRRRDAQADERPGPRRSRPTTSGSTWPQLQGTRRDDRLGPIDGEVLRRLIEATGVPWNGAFGGAAVVVPDKTASSARGADAGRGDDAHGPLADVRRARGAAHGVAQGPERAGLDGPDLEAGLARAMARKGVTRPDLLGDDTPDVEREAGSRFTSDRAVANSTSIAVLADGRRQAGAPRGRRLGARGRVGDSAPAARARPRRSRARRGQARPPRQPEQHERDPARDGPLLALAGLVERRDLPPSGSRDGGAGDPGGRRSGRTGGHAVLPNYRSDETAVWDDAGLRRRYRYEAVYPPADHDGHLRVEV